MNVAHGPERSLAQPSMVRFGLRISVIGFDPGLDIKPE